MAIFDGKSLKGSIGNLVFSKHGKVTIVKTKPGVGGVKQTEATKRRGSVFGKHISPFAKQIRFAFKQLHLGFYDGQMVNRMSSAISSIIYQYIQKEDEFNFNESSFKRLEGFDSNLNSPLNKSLLLLPTVSFKPNKTEVKLPDFSIPKNIRFPKNTDNCCLQIQVTTFHTRKQNTFSPQTEIILIKKPDYVFEGKHLSFDATEDDLVIVGLSLIFSELEVQMPYSPNSKSFHPAGIISAYYNGGNQ